MNKLSRTLTAKWIDARWWLIGLAVLATAAAFPLASRLRYDRSLENLVGRRDPHLQTFRQAQQLFGGDEIVLAVYEDPQLLAADGEGLADLAEITESLSRVDGVAEALSVSRLDQLLGNIGTSIRDTSNPVAIEFRRMFTGYTHNAEFTVAAVICVLQEPDQRAAAIGDILSGLERELNSHPRSRSSGVLVGEPVMVAEGFRFVQQDARWLGWLSLGLLSIIMLVFLRSLRWVLIAAVVVQWTTLLTSALMYVCGLTLSLVSSMLTALVTVIGVAAVMHVAVRFRDGHQQGLAPREALAAALQQLAAPIVWACLTDAVGFGALWWAEAGPVHDFGVMMAVASLVMIVALIVWVPGLALLTPFAAPRSSPVAGKLEMLLQKLVLTVQSDRRSVAIVITVWLVIAMPGLNQLRIETDFTRNFRADSAIARAYAFVEDRLGGAGAWEVIVPAPPRLNDDYVEQVIALEERLRHVETPYAEGRALTSVLSLADTLHASQRQDILAALPAEWRTRGMQALLPGFLAALRGRDQQTGQHYLRILLRAHDRREALHKQWLIVEVERLAERHFPQQADVPPTLVTGYFVLLTNLVAGLLRDQWLCFGISLAGVGAMMAIALRSVRGALAGLLANLLPVLLLLGTAGWLQIKLNMGVAMIAAVALGISVDSSLHYLFAVQRAAKAGLSQQDVLQAAQRNVGRAIVMATLALAAGFASLCTSQFVPTMYFGGLGAIALLAGLLGNLIILPLLLTGRKAPAETNSER